MGEPGVLGARVHAIKPTAKDGVRKLKALTWSEISVRLEGRYLVKGALPASGVSVTFGHSIAGKTFLVLDQALHVALGWEWFGRRVVRAGVIYVAAEGGEGLRNRIEAFRRHHNVAIDEDIPFVLIPEVVDLFQNDVAALVDAVEEQAQRLSIPVGLIVVDTVSKTMGGGKENSDDLAVYVANCERIARHFEATVLLVHHRPKDSDNRTLRGHSSFGAGVDATLIVEYDGNSRTAECLKMKDGEDGWRLAFDLKQLELGKDQDGDPVTSCVVIPKDVPAKKRGEVRLSDKQANALKALCTAVVPPGSNADRSAFATPLSEERVKAIWSSAGVLGERRGDLGDLRNALIRKALVRFDNGEMTITDKGWSCPS